MRLIEPLGLLHGAAAREAIAAGHAMPLAGGPAAFTLARPIGPIGAGPRAAPLPVSALPAEWAAGAARLAAAPPPWAGLAADRPLVMGILNVTPDSFSDGGQHAAPAAAIRAGEAMLRAGADILDIGGESTRPGAAPIRPAEEQARILPVIRALAGQAVLSVDTRHAATMRAALDAGVRIVNDVSGLTHDPEAPALLAQRGAPVVLMHMRGTPADMARHATYADAAVEITRELASRRDAARAAGIAAAAIALDPGIGFAKTPSQSRDMLARLPLLANLGHPVLVGVSRKSFIHHFADVPDPRARLPGSLAAALLALDRGARILRVHDVAETVQAVRLWRAFMT